MKATLKNLTIVCALASVGFAHLVKADIEAVTVIATHLDVKTTQLESDHQNASLKIVNDYAEEILDELDQRLPSQLDSSLKQPTDEQAKVGLQTWTQVSADGLELAAK